MVVSLSPLPAHAPLIPFLNSAHSNNLITLRTGKAGERPGRRRPGRRGAGGPPLGSAWPSRLASAYSMTLPGRLFIGSASPVASRSPPLCQIDPDDASLSHVDGLLPQMVDNRSVPSWHIAMPPGGAPLHRESNSGNLDPESRKSNGRCWIRTSDSPACKAARSEPTELSAPNI